MKTAILATLSLIASSALVKAFPTPFDQLRVFKHDEPEQRLIQYSEDSPAKWMTQDDIDALMRAGIKYMDITEHEELAPVSSLVSHSAVFPTAAHYQDEVAPFIGNLTTQNMHDNLQTFSDFHTRHYKTKWGAQSAEWLHGQISQLADTTDYITVRKFKHEWDQFSIIARFEGTDASLENQVVIVGAHQDSVNMWLPYFGRSPGADDDGSGTVTILEAFRSLVENGFHPERPVEFHWYSAEEAGLLGSQDVASDYQSKGREVIAMLQNDMTGYIGSNGEVIGVVTDHVDDNLTGFLKTMVDTYADINYVETKCGYACSDHASWRKAGYPSAFTIESEFGESNHYIHTSEDTLDKLSFDHMKEFAKVAVGFAVELSHQK
ncbi:Zn-dependent exopeptidase [Hesseltinella vesiculosa]|uniref:Peptide hydrolase n=1 Tax=Hesseltinella vesiculosa TaxID=101127 RepID=A0A1X2G8Q9_9FUNG|nr:Zn-dependent exopeptidase [Hesseltinella vesiculosa]